MIYERLNIYTLAFPYCLTKSFIRLHIMNGLVLCTGANKTVGSLEFSKTSLQPLVKSRKREQLLVELEQEHEATRGGGNCWKAPIKWASAVAIVSEIGMQDHRILVSVGRGVRPHDRWIGMQRMSSRSATLLISLGILPFLLGPCSGRSAVTDCRPVAKQVILLRGASSCVAPSEQPQLCVSEIRSNKLIHGK